MWAWEMGADSRISYVTPGAGAILGYSPEQLCHLRMEELLADSTKKEFSSLIDSELQSGPLRFKGQFRCRDGRWIWAEISVAVLKAEKGKNYGFRVLCRNLSGEISESEALQIREKEYRYLFDNTQVGIFVLDASGRYLNVNQTGAGIHGRVPEEMIGRKFTEFFDDEQGDRFFKAFSEVYQRAASHDDNHIDVPNRVVRFSTPKGMRYLQVVPKAIRVVENGKMSGILFTGLDATEIQTLYEKLDRHQKHLKRIVSERTQKIKALQEDLLRNERLTALGRLTSKVSHEIRNPLGTINSSLYVLKERLKGEDFGVMQAIDRGFRAIRRCDGIIEEMLDFTRTKGLEKRTVDVSHWLEKVLEDTKLEDGVVLKKRIERGLTAPIDSVRLQRCLSNILENAMEAMADGHGETLVVSARGTHAGLEIDIEDTGRGLSPEEQKKVFDPLYSTKKNGTGMGLPVSSRVMELHGGTIHLSSIPGEGTRVVLQLPA